MPDVMSQNEIDTLLSDINAESLEVAAPAAAPAAAAGDNFNIYDFKRPERVSKDQIHSMAMMHEVLARKLGASLSAYLRTIVEVKLASVEQLTYQEFIMSLPNPTCFNLLSCEPLDGSMVLEINPLIVFPILDKLLGGGRDVYIPEREMSNIEWRLMSRIISDTLAFLRESWRPILDINFKVVQTEANPQLMQIVPPNEVVILICFEIKTGGSSGMLNLCIPFPVIEPIMGRFSTIQTWFTTKKSHSEEEEKRNLYSGLGRATLTAAVQIATTRLTVQQFLSLKPGDIIRTDKEIRRPLVMTVAGKPKFLGYAGQYCHHKAFRVLRPIEPDEEVAC